MSAAVLQAKNLIEQASHSAFGCIDTRNMEQRRNLHRKRAIVVFLGLECAYEIVRGRAEFARLRRERASMWRKSLDRRNEERAPFRCPDLPRNFDFVICIAAEAAEVLQALTFPHEFPPPLRAAREQNQAGRLRRDLGTAQEPVGDPDHIVLAAFGIIDDQH